MQKIPTSSEYHHTGGDLNGHFGQRNKVKGNLKPPWTLLSLWVLALAVLTTRTPPKWTIHNSEKTRASYYVQMLSS